ncbi:MAG: HAMP domain-containing histidine kinase [Melioribacteraceae bacterium]|nr:HAMP domain-containing histidine kinase [Melioribacteraceae bacterium]MCF8355344.1 HAMP domain-containing histidine kinase [Melioribacteraceae bacterium]MCF8392342.1 HAMP domain-containing histidine kinase [Melioribacteraceae bacterium]MCF8417862.1 HAMP domain-containing histidine kinase [Melioribacteraceae bacterium]
MKMSGGPASLRIKLLLLSIAIAIALGTLYYTQNLVEKLQNREREVVELYAKALQYIADSESLNNDFTFIFENIIKRIDFPLILTDEFNQVPYDPTGSGIRNLEIDSTLTSNEVEIFLQKKIQELGSRYDPIIVYYPANVVWKKIYYGDSNLIQALRFYPYLQILLAFVFISIAYLSFSYIKKSEQSNIWVGMSKETAHQLGTPISSLMGWSEILKMNLDSPDKVADVAEEIDSDLSRLNKIAHRFSKIGSKPELKIENVYQIVSRVNNYFHRRLPHTGKNVVLEIKGDHEVAAMINAELFEWVLENLIKNALDAIEHKEGSIKFNIINNNKTVEIDVSDNGKGIDLKHRKDIFRPGYSTKKRGWGLGLSLSKRIVEDYHKGKIFVKNSIPNESTTFKIVLIK